MLNKRELTRQALIAKLFYSMLKYFKLENINFEFSYNDNNELSFYYYHQSKNCGITIDLNLLHKFLKMPMDDDYYIGRGDKINFMLNNKHNYIRFILLHELNHFITFQKNKDNYKNISKIDRELTADDFGLCYYKAF